MAIAVRGSAWSPFTTLVRTFDTDFDLLRRAFAQPALVRRPAYAPLPAAEVTKDGADVVVTVELPGVDVDKDVDVEVAEGRLAITGRTRTGAFRRDFALPKAVLADQVEADYDRGLLKVRVRDVIKPAVQPTKVKVRSIAAATTEELPAEQPAAVEGAQTESE